MNATNHTRPMTTLRVTTIADQIADIPDYLAAINKAEQFAIETDQDWDNEATIFTFADGSQVKFSELEIDRIKVTRPENYDMIQKSE